jgi:5S rRNA maturation endonuclease (ribonuclease M5)
MSETAYERILDALADAGRRTVRSGRGVDAQCPAHDDRTPSLSVTPIEGSVLLHCHSGCEVEDVLAALHMSKRDMFDEPRGDELARYQYTDTAGRPTRTVHRFEGKEFRQSGDKRLVQLYRLPKVVEAIKAGRTIYLVEGEKDVHALESLGEVATTAPQGARNFDKADVSPLKGAQIVAVVDRDAAGQKWAAAVVERLDGYAADLRLVEAAEGKDSADHVAAGHPLDALVPLDPRVFPVPHPRGEEHGNTLYFDVGAYLDGGERDAPEPVLMYREDGHAIFYAAQVNYIFGDPESGKTLVVQAAMAEALNAGRRGLFIDIDHNGAQATICRFIDYGVPEEILRDPARFRYVEPDDREHLMAIVKDAKQWQPAVAAVDSVGELLPLMGLNSNSPDDFTIAHTAVLKPLAKAGAAVLAVDHLPKSTETRVAGPTGTAAKRRAVGGVSIRVTINEQFAPGRAGSAWLALNKDRHGGLRRYCLAEGREPSVGLFKLDSTGVDITWSVQAPKLGEAAAAAGVRADDLTALDKLDPEPRSVRDVKERLRWNSNRAADTLREWRSRRSRGVPGEQGSLGHTPPVTFLSCRVCGEPMHPAAAAGGFDTHPGCNDAP